ncbi:MAG: HU family DNA-binding protein [Mangrovibacterium sp.]
MKDPNKKDEEQQPEIPDWLKPFYIPFDQTVSLDMLCKAISQETGLSLEKVKEAVFLFEKVTFELVKKGQTVDLQGLGKFYPILKEGDSYDPNDEFEIGFEPSEALLERLKKRIEKGLSAN